MDFQLQFDADLASEKTRKKDVQVSQHILNIYIYIYIVECVTSLALFAFFSLALCHVMLLAVLSLLRGNRVNILPLNVFVFFT